MAGNDIVSVRRNFPRPGAEVLRSFEGLPTGYLTDAMGRRGALSAAIRPVGNFRPFVGSALTVTETAGSNLASGVAMGELQPDDVLMINAESFIGAAVFGGNMAGMYRNGGVVALVTDGAVRDAQELEEIGVPVYARAVTPNSPFKHGPGSVGLDIELGGVKVCSGDVIVGDRDGVVVVPHGEIADVLKRLEQVKKKEQAQDDEISKGLVIPKWLAEFEKDGGIKLVG